MKFDDIRREIDRTCPVSAPHDDLVRELAGEQSFVLAGRLTASSHYNREEDGDEWLSHVTFAIELDQPRGEIVMVELEDLLDALSGRHVTLAVVSEIPAKSEAPR